MLTSERLTVTLTELEQTWGIVDLLEAHMALDVWDELNWKAQQDGGS